MWSRMACTEGQLLQSLSAASPCLPEECLISPTLCVSKQGNMMSLTWTTANGGQPAPSLSPSLGLISLRRQCRRQQSSAAQNCTIKKNNKQKEETQSVIWCLCARREMKGRPGHGSSPRRRGGGGGGGREVGAVTEPAALRQVHTPPWPFTACVCVCFPAVKRCSPAHFYEAGGGPCAPCAGEGLPQDPLCCPTRRSPRRGGSERVGRHTPGTGTQRRELLMSYCCTLL